MITPRLAALLVFLFGETLAQPPLDSPTQRVSTETSESVGAFDVIGDGRPDLAVAGKDGLAVFFNEGVVG